MGIHSTAKESYVITKGKNKIMLSNRGRVSVLETSSRERVYAALSPSSFRTVDELVKLHERMAHMSFDRMIQVLKAGTTEGLGTLDAPPDVLATAKMKIQNCDACVRGKITKTPFGHSGISHSHGAFEAIHMDTFEVTGISAQGKAIKQYGLTMRDPYSSAQWFAKADKKDDISPLVIQIIKNDPYSDWSEIETASL